MNPFDNREPWKRVLRYTAFVGSAALIALLLRLSLERPWLSVVAAAVALTALVPPYVSRRRFRRLLLSGDAERVVAIWRNASTQGPNQETTGPLISATAFAAYGWVDAARAQLHRVHRGPAWEASAEHRMFVETLLEAFDGDRAHAMELAEAIAALPVPPVSSKMREQVVQLREAVAALARAFAHQAHDPDLDVLERVAKTSPLVSWAMRYAAAIIAVDRGETWRVPGLLAQAPMWPQQSAFRVFHDELMARVGGERG